MKPNGLPRPVSIAGVEVWSEDTSGARKFLLQDHLGSVRITGNASGTLYDDLDYLPFGEVIGGRASPC